MGVYSNIYIDSVTTDELNGLFSVKSVLSLELSRQELGANIECRVETPALENIVSNHIHIDLQGKIQEKNIIFEALLIKQNLLLKSVQRKSI